MGIVTGIIVVVSICTIYVFTVSMMYGLVLDNWIIKNYCNLPCKICSDKMIGSCKTCTYNFKDYCGLQEKTESNNICFRGEEWVCENSECIHLEECSKSLDEGIKRTINIELNKLTFSTGNINAIL